jgi:hypothetical protein
VSGGAELELFVWQIEEQSRSALQQSGAVDESFCDDFVRRFFINAHPLYLIYYRGPLSVKKQDPCPE